MLSTVFLKSLRDQVRPFIWWGLGAISIMLMYALLYPWIANNPSYNTIIQTMPEELRTLLLGSLQEQDMTSPIGYLNTELFSMVLPLLMLVYGIYLGSAAIAGEEEKQTLDLLLANPVSRTRVVVEKFLAMCVVALALGAVLWLSMWAGAMMVGMDLSIANLAAAIFSGTLLGLAFGGIGLGIGAATGSKGMSMGIATALGVLAYLLHSLAPMIDWLKPYQALSPFYQYIGNNPLRNGLAWEHALVLVAIAAVMLGVGVVGFRRRDLAV